MNKPQTEKLVTEQRKFLGSAQGVVEIKMASPDSKFLKVLALSGDAQIASYECLVKEAKLSGRVNVKMLYSDDDGNVSCLNYNADFKENFLNESIAPGTKLSFNCVITDIAPAESEGNSVTVRCALETGIFADFVNETECVTNCGIKHKKETIGVCRLLFSQEKSFTAIQETSAKFNIGKVLIADGKAVVSSVIADDGMLTVKGEAFVAVTFQTAGKEFETMIVGIPFSEEISAKECCKEATVRASASVKSTKLHMEVHEGENNRSFTAECEVAVSLKGYLAGQKEAVIDAFSFDEEVKIVGESFSSSFPEGYFSHFYKVDGTLHIGDLAKPDQVYCCACPKVIVIGCTAYENEIVMEGILSGNLLYLEEEKLSSTSFEVPFVANVERSGMSSSSQVSCDAVITELTFKMGKGGTAEIIAGVKLGFNSYRDCTNFVIKDLVSEGKKEINCCAIETLCVKKGMTMWNMEKFLRLSGEEILKCNPGLNLPLEEDKKIIVYRQLKE